MQVSFQGLAVEQVRLLSAVRDLVLMLISVCVCVCVCARAPWKRVIHTCLIAAARSPRLTSALCLPKAKGGERMVCQSAVEW